MTCGEKRPGALAGPLKKQREISLTDEEWKDIQKAAGDRGKSASKYLLDLHSAKKNKITSLDIISKDVFYKAQNILEAKREAVAETQSEVKLQIPYGYKEENGRIVPDEYQSKIVKLIADLVNDGATNQEADILFNEFKRDPGTKMEIDEIRKEMLKKLEKLREE